MLTDKETHYFCKDCKHLRIVTDPDDNVPLRCALTERAIGRRQVICDAEKERMEQAGVIPEPRLPWYMVYICNTSLSRKPG